MAEALNELMEKWAARLREIGIPVSKKINPETVINTRAKKRLGCCISKNGIYTIEISVMLLQEKEKSTDLLVATLIHELLHTCPGCGNHGATWKHYAQLAEKALGYRITRTTELDMPQETLTPKYVICCQQCGVQMPRQRSSAVVQHPEKYRCGKCGGRLKVYVRQEIGESRKNGK